MEKRKSKNMEIKFAYKYRDEVKLLFTEYTKMLVENDPKFQEYLDLQNYDDELDHLEAKYGLPDGRLYLLFCEGKAAGCIGLRKIDEESCELKRLYVRPEFRNQGLGSALVEKIINDAREVGYSQILLDTLPFLESAIRMYRSFGFYEIESYNNSPMDTSIYMRLDVK